MLTHAGPHSFKVPASTGKMRITVKGDIPITVDGVLVSIPPEGLYVDADQEVAWIVPETTREEVGPVLHFDD
jgi:hypothetical protein